MPIVRENFVVNNCLSVKDASGLSGYSQQYLRRLLRNETLVGLKLGQLWLIRIESFEGFLSEAENSEDHRFGPKRNSPTD